LPGSASAFGVTALAGLLGQINVLFSVIRHNLNTLPFIQIIFPAYTLTFGTGVELGGLAAAPSVLLRLALHRGIHSCHFFFSGPSYGSAVKLLHKNWFVGYD
jgi:hypothetical protein